MAKKYQQNLRDKLKEHFREHPYFKLCKAVFMAFQEECSTMVMTPEELFEDASRTLDRVLNNGDFTAELCQDLWIDKFTQYRERDEKVGGKEDATKTEVAVLFYVVMYALQAVNHSHYRGTLQRTLHDSIFKLYYGDNIKKCLNVEQKLREPVNRHAQDMMAWMETYFNTTESLADEIYKLFHPDNKAAKNKNLKKEIIYYTLSYNCPEEKLRVKRISAVEQMMFGWKWIEEPQVADDFYHFFDGKPRNCNLKWIGRPVAILSELLKQLLNQYYMVKIKGVTSRSIVINQFGKTPSGNKERIDAKEAQRIQWVIDLLDYNKPLPLPKNSDNEIFDNAYLAAMQAVFAKELHITRDLNRTYK